MGTRKKFSAAEQELLRANPYTEKVTEHCTTHQTNAGEQRNGRKTFSTTANVG